MISFKPSACLTEGMYLYLDWKPSSLIIVRGYLRETAKKLFSKYPTPSQIICICHDYVSFGINILNNIYYFGFDTNENNNSVWDTYKDNRNDLLQIIVYQNFIHDVVCSKIQHNEQNLHEGLVKVIQESQIIALKDWVNEDKIDKFKPIFFKKDEFKCIDNDKWDFNDLLSNNETKLKFFDILNELHDIQTMIENSVGIKFYEQDNIELNMKDLDKSINSSILKESFKPLILENCLEIETLRYKYFVYVTDITANYDEYDDYDKKIKVIQDLKEMVANIDESDESVINKLMAKIKEGWADLVSFTGDIVENTSEFNIFNDEQDSLQLLTQINKLILTQLLPKYFLSFFETNFVKSFIISIPKQKNIWGMQPNEKQLFLLGIMKNGDLAALTTLLH